MLLFMLVFFILATAASVGMQTYFLSFFDQNAGWSAFGAAFVAALVPALAIVFVNVGVDALRNRPRTRKRRG